jgi:hypothetical protein
MTAFAAGGTRPQAFPDTTDLRFKVERDRAASRPKPIGGAPFVPLRFERREGLAGELLPEGAVVFVIQLPGFMVVLHVP